MIKTILKRDSISESFNITKIETAIKKAMLATEDSGYITVSEKLAKEVEEMLEKQYVVKKF